MPRALCDAGARVLLGLHLGYLAFVLLGAVLLVEGAVLGWSWTRRPGWRGAHLAAVLGVCALQALGWACPLTAAEDRLRACAGRPAYREGFLGDRFGAAPGAVRRAEFALGAVTLGGLLFAPLRRTA